MKFPVGTRVEVTVSRVEAPPLVLRGKVVEATRDYATAECRKPDGSLIRFTYDGGLYVTFRRLTGRDFARRR